MSLVAYLIGDGMINTRANQLMAILAKSTPTELDLRLTLQFASLIDQESDVMLHKLRKLHDLGVSIEGMLYSSPAQIAVTMAIAELENATMVDNNETT